MIDTHTAQTGITNTHLHMKAKQIHNFTSSTASLWPRCDRCSYSTNRTGMSTPNTHLHMKAKQIRTFTSSMESLGRRPRCERYSQRKKFGCVRSSTHTTAPSHTSTFTLVASGTAPDVNEMRQFKNHWKQNTTYSRKSKMNKHLKVIRR